KTHPRIRCLPPGIRTGRKIYLRLGIAAAWSPDRHPLERVQCPRRSVSRERTTSASCSTATKHNARSNRRRWPVSACWIISPAWWPPCSVTTATRGNFPRLAAASIPKAGGQELRCARDVDQDPAPACQAPKRISALPKPRAGRALPVGKILFQLAVKGSDQTDPHP